MFRGNVRTGNVTIWVMKVLGLWMGRYLLVGGCPQCGVLECGSCMVRVTVDSLTSNTLELRKT